MTYYGYSTVGYPYTSDTRIPGGRLTSSAWSQECGSPLRAAPQGARSRLRLSQVLLRSASRPPHPQHGPSWRKGGPVRHESDRHRERSGISGMRQRAAGQASAVAAMITDRRPFADIAQPVLGARGSLQSLHVRLVELEPQECVPNPTARGQVDGLIRAFGRTGPSRHAARSAAFESQGPPAPFTVEGRTSP